LLIAKVLRQYSFLAIEALAGSALRSRLGISASFGDDALSYFTERLDPEPTRLALAATLHRAKRNKAFDGSRFLGLAIDGTGAGRSRQRGCNLCRPYRDHNKQVVGYRHQLTMISVVGTGLSLPCVSNLTALGTVSMLRPSVCCGAHFPTSAPVSPIT